MDWENSVSTVVYHDPDTYSGVLPGGAVESQDPAWVTILSDVRKLCEDYPNGIVVIGGAAIWLHTRSCLDQQFLQTSHDADFYMGLQDFASLRDMQEVVRNRRLGKYQMIRNDVDFDIYVERNNDLVISYEDAQRFSESIDGIRCACKEHLLILKLRAFEDRMGSAKGSKDAKDIARLLVLLAEQPGRKAQSLSLLRDEDLAFMKKIVDNPNVFQDIVQKNAHWAKQLRALATRGLDYVTSTHEHQNTLSDRTPRPISKRSNDGPEFGG